jgi:hypothetical protein
VNNEPTINLALLDAEAGTIAARFLVTRGPSKGRVMTNRPKDNEAYYVWRMVRFYASPDPRASCMPMAAAYALPHDRHDHAGTCGRSTTFYASIEAAYTRGTGIYDDHGNFRLACTCGATERQATADAAAKAEQARLDAVVTRILATIPLRQQYGLRRWTHAMHGVDPFNNGDITDPANHHIVDAQDELDGVLM